MTTHPLRRAALLAVALLHGSACGPSAAPAARSASVDGQWVWSAADVARLSDARRTVPALLPGVWVATIAFAHDGVTQRLALSPAVAGATGPVAAVIRFDDAFHAAWGAADDATLARTVGARVAALTARLDAAAPRVVEVQLDYDCPERRLPRWAALVHALARGPLAGRTVWVTSLPAHVRHPEYGALLRGAVAGHIVQLFDTGVRPTPAALAALSASLDRQALPYRVGLGAFERVRRDGARTEHLAWFAAGPLLARSPWYRGRWVFPAGARWVEHLPEPTLAVGTPAPPAP
jgi:hypothetical protein